MNARWTKKNNETQYGYKDYAKFDVYSKITINYAGSDAYFHDSQSFSDFLPRRIRLPMLTVHMLVRNFPSMLYRKYVKKATEIIC